MEEIANLLKNKTMDKNKSGDTLNLKAALEKIDKEKHPQLYKRTEELIKAKEIILNQKIRAEKAEKLAKKTKEPAGDGTPKKPEGEETPKNLPYSLQDIRSLSGVHDDDVERVEKFAKSENLSITEALKNDDLLAILRDREEKRATASASNTGKSRRGTTETSVKELLKKFKLTGELPESDEEIEKLAEARLKEKMGSR